MLSAKELSAGIARNLSQSVPKRGLKSTTPSGSWREEEEIDRCLDQEKSLLGAQRIEKKCMRSIAEWVDEKGKAKVTTKKGKHWCNFGFEKDRALWLNPEEALYLVETNVLELQHGGITLSVQHAFHLIVGTQVTLESYRVYSKLQRLGWIVFRCENCHVPQATPSKAKQPPPLLPSTKKTPDVEVVEVIDLDEEDRFKVFDQFVPNIKDKSQVLVRVAPNHLLPPNTVPVRKEYVLKFGGSPAGGPPPLQHSPHFQQNQPYLQNQRFPSNAGYYNSSNFNNHQVQQQQLFQRYVNQQRQFRFHMQQTNLVGNFLHSQRLEFQFRGPLPNYHNQQQQPSYNQYTPYRPRWRQTSSLVASKPQRDQIPFYEKAGPSNVRLPAAPASRAFKSWSELKAKDSVIETITLESDDRSDKFSESHLVEPNDCKTYRSVLRKLQIFGDGVVEKDPADLRKLRVKFNVFPPSPNFRKSQLPAPKYQVVITSFDNDVPSESEIGLIEGMHPIAVLLFAVIQPDSIQFITLENVELDLKL